MKINKIGVVVGLLIVSGLFIYIVGIDSEIICNPPKVSDTVSGIERTINTSLDYDGFAFCMFIKPPVKYNDKEFYDKNE